MAKTISDRVLERMQKDLDGFDTRYQERLDARIAATGKDLREIWTSTEEYINRKVDKLYQEYEKYTKLGLEAPANKALRKLEHLTAIGGELNADLAVLEGKLQPYYTEALSNEYKRSYYERGYGLSQAAQVAVNVPILTDSHVLGVIANPWLGDPANYSTRLRRNTAYLAEKMEQVIKIATVEGLGASEAAQLITAVTDEGYSRALTLFRTEMNRASSLASSYSYMKNADILDEKRWNATLDKDTAPRDAANDGNTYDLDYDTPENPGIPGQRIPNHPNCRCKYSPVLSALGIRNKGRIARLNGERSYTDAGTYREWAKEVGLPDLDERLERDNLKRYLRPGESAADLSKRVTRVRTPGGTIHIATPAWSKAGKKLDSPTKVKAAFKDQPQKPGFTAATTVEEATQFAKQFADKVDYGKMSLESINQVNETLTGLMVEGVPKMAAIKVLPGNTKAFKSGAMGSYNFVYNELYLNNTVLKDQKAIAKFVKKVKEAEEAVKAISPAQYGRLSTAQKAYLSKYERIGRQLVDGNSLEGILTHEIGHHVDFTVLTKTYTDKAYRRGFDEAGEKLSVYATTNEAEYVAEAFTAYHKGERDRVRSDLLEILDKIYGGG